MTTIYDLASSEDMLAHMEQVDLQRCICEAISTLSLREQVVIILRFGLEDGRELIPEEIGKEFNVTKERIRQIEAKALRKLRYHTSSIKLKDYINGSIRNK